MFEMSFTLKVRYRDAAVFFGDGFCPPITGEPKGVIAGNVTENEGNRCARERAFNVKIAPIDSIK